MRAVNAHSRPQSTQEDSAPHCAPTSIAIDGVSGLSQAMNVSQRSLASNKAAMQQRLRNTRSVHSRRVLVTPRKGSCVAAAASKGCKLVGVGSAAPATVLSNDDLSKLVDTNDEWIAARTGIRRRHVLAKGESLTQLAAKASQHAMEMAGVQPEQIDMVLFACSSPDDLFGGACQVGCRSARTDPCKAHTCHASPSRGAAQLVEHAACMYRAGTLLRVPSPRRADSSPDWVHPLMVHAQVQAQIGAKNAVAFDITAACSGFVISMVTAAQYIRTGAAKNVLVVGADALSRFVDWRDRGGLGYHDTAYDVLQYCYVAHCARAQLHMQAHSQD